MKNVKSGHTKPIVCLDAGHYGKYNRSPANKAYYESDMAWKLHMLVKGYLESYDIIVTQTRDSQDKDKDLYERGMASKDSDLFLSYHSNATGSGINESIDHVAVYHLTDDTTTDIDEASKEFANMIAPVIAETMGTTHGSKVLTRLSSNDRNNDGMMNDNYYGVLNGARAAGTPGLILEHSFHTNTRMTNWLLDEKNLDKLAQAEAKIIAQWFDVEKIEEVEEQPVEPGIKSGDVVKIAPDAVYYNGKQIPSWVKNQQWIVSSVNGDRIVINKNVDNTSAINSPINAKFLTIVSNDQDIPFLVKVTISDLNVRTGPGTSYDRIKYIPRGIYTIVEVSGDWGRLKSKQPHKMKLVNGWIHLGYTTKV